MSSAQGIRLLVVLAAGNFLSILNGFVVVGLLPDLQEEFQLSATAAGLIVSAFTAAYVVVSPLLGWLSAKLGYRRSLAMAMGFCSLSAVMAMLAPNVGLLALSRVVSALGSAFYTPTAAALAIAEAGPAARGRALSAIFAGASIAQILGIPVGAILSVLFGWRVAFAMVAILAALMVVVLLLQVPTDRKPVAIQLSHFGKVFRLEGVWQVLLLSTLSSFTTSVIFTFMAGIFQRSGGATDVTLPIFLALVGVGALLGTVVIGFAMDRAGPLRVLAGQILLSAMIVAPLTYINYPPSIGMVLAIALGAAMFTKMPPIQHRLSTLASDHTHLIFPINASMVYIGTATGPLVGGAIIDRLGWQWLGPIDALLLLGLFLWMLHMRRTARATAALARIIAREHDE